MTDQVHKLSASGVQENSIVFDTGCSEMLRVAQDGFYVRGKKIPVDDQEAEIVYNAFKHWLAWANLQQGN